jgi:ABC-type transporter Mla subunit MlaD
LVQFFASLHIPRLIQFGSAGLFALAVFFGFRMLLEAIRVRRWIGSAAKVWEPFKSSSTSASGMEPRITEELRLKSKTLSYVPKLWWRRIDDSLELYTSPEQKDSWFVLRPLREILPVEDVVGSHYHHAFHAAVPGILTGLGLALTFLAILLALAGVTYSKTDLTEPVKGMEGLINGLSGKFVSSILALVLSVLFTFLERATTRNVRRSHEELLALTSQVFPYLSPSRILLDLQRFASKQTVSVSHISSEVVDRFIGAFRTEVSPALAEGVSAGMAMRLQDEFRPTMQQMNGTLVDLRSAITSLESQKQESVTGELRSLLQSVETSIVGTLNKMGGDFHQALTGAATREFGNVQGTLESTRTVLGEMNGQFSDVQKAFSLIVQKAEEATSQQLLNGRQQTEALTAVMHALIEKLHRSADENVGSIRNQLTIVVADLSDRIGALSQELLSASQTATNHSQASAQKVIDQAGAWSENTARRLETLVESIESRSKDFNQAGQALMQAHGALKETLAQNSAAVTQMAAASGNVQAYSEALIAQVESLKTVQRQQTETTSKLQQASNSIVTVFNQHGDYLVQYQRIFSEYKQVFDTLDGRLAKTLETVQGGLQQYAAVMEGNFRDIVKITNEALPQIATTLSGQMSELETQLEELGSIFDKGIQRLNARAR